MPYSDFSFEFLDTIKGIYSSEGESIVEVCRMQTGKPKVQPA